MSKKLEAHTRRLTQFLVASGLLNIALVSTFVYSVLKDREIVVPIERKPASTTLQAALTNGQLLRAYSTLSFADLLLRLENKELVEDGYNRRDLALACLASFHHFNLERALGGLELQKRLIPFQNAQGEEQIPLVIFPGLADFQYQAILHYARTEKWPFTAQGLFFEIQRAKPPYDPSLLEAFYLTPHFHTVQLLFTRTGVKIDRELLVEMLAQGDWNILNMFTQKQREAQDLTIESRRALLLEYLNARSTIAAKLLLEADLEFTVKRMSDQQILALFDLLPAAYVPLNSFARELISSPRADGVWKKAASLLYVNVGESTPEPYDHLVTLSRFAPHLLPTPVQAPIVALSQDTKVTPTANVSAKISKPRIHVVGPGENLWKIARKYRVSVEAIKRQNKLDSERLRVGKELEIP